MLEGINSLMYCLSTAGVFKYKPKINELKAAKHTDTAATKPDMIHHVMHNFINHLHMSTVNGGHRLHNTIFETHWGNKHHFVYV